MRSISYAFILSILSLTLASTAFAQATRTWVSGVGDDANPCSRTAPCKTFAGAISKTATGGEINTIDSGGFGAVTITKSITIDGGSTLAGVLASGTNGIIINALSPVNVILRNLDINGIGTGLSGIKMLTGGQLSVENVKIYGFTQPGINLIPSGDVDFLVQNSDIANNAQPAISVAPGAAATAMGTVNDTRLVGNTRGLQVNDGAQVTVKNSVLSQNGVYGLAVSGTARPASVALDNTILSGNSTAGVRANGAMGTVRLSSSVVTQNGVGLETAAGGIVYSYGNNRMAGNTGGVGSATTAVAQQ